MNTSNLTLEILALVIMCTALSTEQQPALSLGKRMQQKAEHLMRCLQGKDPCSKTDLVILATSLLVVRSSFYALLAVGKYRYEPSAHVSVDESPDKVELKGVIGNAARAIDMILDWGPGKLPEKIVRNIRMWWATVDRTKNPA